jgi:pimeloyl-ACP methyl ester carboxylesterase
MDMAREKVRFVSGDVACAAWYYPGSNGGCVVMAGGFGVTKEPGTDLFAGAFQRAGYAVLAFDYRRLGESGGEPRQIAHVGHQLADWQAAINFATTLPGVNPTKIAIWAFSLSGGYIFPIAAQNPQLAAAIAQTPNADGPAATRNAARHQKPLAMLRFTGRAMLDLLGSLIGRPPRLIPLVGKPGTVALLTTPDAQHSDDALNPHNKYPDWTQAIAARSALRVTFYRPGRSAAKVKIPLLVLVAEQDQSALAQPAIDAAQRAPHATLIRVPGGHYAPFLEQHELAVAAELAFLHDHLLDQPASSHQTPAPRDQPADTDPATWQPT